MIVKQDNVGFEYDLHPYVLLYRSLVSPTILSVYLTCIESGPDQITGLQDDPNTYNIYLQSQCCCPGKCIYVDDSGGMSGGAVFLIILFSFGSAYIIFGMLFLRYQRGASGFEMIPNRLMWLSLASLALHGTRYSLRVIRHRSFDVNYESV